MPYVDVKLKDEFKAPIAFSNARKQIVIAYRVFTSGNLGMVAACREIDDLRNGATKQIWVSSYELLKNSGWFNVEEVPDENPEYPWGWFKIEEVPDENPKYTWAEYRKTQDTQSELLDKAVNDDAEAAIEFCKLYKAGKINLHSAMG